MQHVQRYGKIFHGQMLKSATSDYDQHHVIAFRPISVAARSWPYDNRQCLLHLFKSFSLTKHTLHFQHNTAKEKLE